MIAEIQRDLILLNRIAEVMEASRPPAEVLDELFPMLFERVGLSGRVWSMTSGTEWETGMLTLAMNRIEDIVIRYVQLFQDPRTIPVTSYRKQKKIAIHLDLQFAKLLRESASRSGALAWMGSEERDEKDPFLDEPILFLKQEARTKGFPKAKRKSEGVSLEALRERYETKVLSKGIRPLQTFTYGP